jgi:hypothetical protein
VHTLILGATESGKTTLAKNVCKELVAGKKQTLVLDPLGSQWPTQNVFTDPDLFLKFFWATQGSYVFIDESGETVGRVNKEMEKTGTRGRHNGHSVFFITQSRTQLSPILRRQCAQLFCFAIGGDEAKFLAEEWICPDLVDAPMLPQGTCFWVRRFWQGKAGGVKKINIFT